MNIGDKAPEILGTDQDGKEIRLSDYKGQKVVLYFYPKDSTAGCTAQACNLRDNYDALRAKGYAVVGVSIQDEKSHRKFIEKNGLPFPLIADTDLKLVETFGVYGEKKMYGRTYMGTYRTTFILNEDGIVERILGPSQIRTKDHAGQILAEDKSTRYRNRGRKSRDSAVITCRTSGRGQEKESPGSTFREAGALSFLSNF